MSATSKKVAIIGGGITGLAAAHCLQSALNQQELSLALSWSASEDSRVQYRVYEVNGEERTLLSTVVGGNFYYQPKLNIFSTSHYEVVPYDSLTHQEGTRSNIAASDMAYRR